LINKDPECCDGSDENSGIIKCPNICEQIAYEQNKEEIEKKRILKDVLYYIKLLMIISIKWNKVLIIIKKKTVKKWK